MCPLFSKITGREGRKPEGGRKGEIREEGRKPEGGREKGSKGERKEGREGGRKEVMKKGRKFAEL